MYVTINNLPTLQTEGQKDRRHTIAISRYARILASRGKNEHNYRTATEKMMQHYSRCDIHVNVKLHSWTFIFGKAVRQQI